MTNPHKSAEEKNGWQTIVSCPSRVEAAILKIGYRIGLEEAKKAAEDCPYTQPYEIVKAIQAKIKEVGE